MLPATRQRWESRLYPQPKQVLDLATLEGCKAELTYVTCIISSPYWTSVTQALRSLLSWLRSVKDLTWNTYCGELLQQVCHVTATVRQRNVRSIDSILHTAQQGVALTGRNTTGPPWSVGRPTNRAPGARPACPLAVVVVYSVLQTTDDDDRRQQAKQYWYIRLASYNSLLSS